MSVSNEVAPKRPENMANPLTNWIYCGTCARIGAIARCMLGYPIARNQRAIDQGVFTPILDRPGSQ